MEDVATETIAITSDKNEMTRDIAITSDKNEMTGDLSQFSIEDAALLLTEESEKLSCYDAEHSEHQTIPVATPVPVANDSTASQFVGSLFSSILSPSKASTSIAPISTTIANVAQMTSSQTQVDPAAVSKPSGANTSDSISTTSSWWKNVFSSASKSPNETINSSSATLQTHVDSISSDSGLVVASPAMQVTSTQSTFFDKLKNAFTSSSNVRYPKDAQWFYNSLFSQDNLKLAPSKNRLLSLQHLLSQYDITSGAHWMFNLGWNRKLGINSTVSRLCGKQGISYYLNVVSILAQVKEKAENKFEDWLENSVCSFIILLLLYHYHYDYYYYDIICILNILWLISCIYIIY